MDPFREPSRWNGSRFRYEELSYSDASGKQFPALLFRPCDRSCRNMPAGLKRYQPPYPGVVIMHGGAASQEMYLWAAEGLAEAGYMVLTFSIARTDSSHYADTKSALELPDLRANPRWSELDRRHIGLAGHSAGGVAVSRLGQEDPRVAAIVSWDRAQSGRMPAGLRLRTPALFVAADFNCQQVPVCLPVRYSSPPDPLGPGNKDEDFQRVRRAGVDTMKIALRAMTHLTFTEFPQANGSRYGNADAFYYTLAWFDRYLRRGDAARSPAHRHEVRHLRRCPQHQRRHLRPRDTEERAGSHRRSSSGRPALVPLPLGLPPRDGGDTDRRTCAPAAPPRAWRAAALAACQGGSRSARGASVRPACAEATAHSSVATAPCAAAGEAPDSACVAVGDSRSVHVGGGSTSWRRPPAGTGPGASAPVAACQAPGSAALAASAAACSWATGPERDASSMGSGAGASGSSPWSRAARRRTRDRWSRRLRAVGLLR